MSALYEIKSYRGVGVGGREVKPRQRVSFVRDWRGFTVCTNCQGAAVFLLQGGLILSDSRAPKKP